MEMIRRYGDQAYARGFKVTTTVEARLQRAAQDALRTSLLEYDRRHGYRGAEAKLDINGASDEDLDAYLEDVSELPLLTAGVVTRSGATEATVYIGGGRRVTIGPKQVAWAKRWLNENASGRSPAKVSDVVAVGDLVRVGQNAEGTWYLRQAPKVTGALVSLSPQDGAIRALVGGYVYGDSKFNRAVDARRQPGSSFKPFVYAAALEKGWTAASRVKDEPIRVPLGRGTFWEPENFDHKTMGVIPMRTAVALSRNLAAVNTLQSVGLKYATDFVTRFGFDLAKMPLGLSMALGTAEVSPLKMAEAYAVFANGGFRVEPYLIQRIETAAGERVFEATPAHACSDCWFRYGKETAQTQGLAGGPEAERVLDPRLVYEMQYLLEAVITSGTATRAKTLGRSDIAGKTGTTNDVRDSWFCGYQKDFVTVAWMGFDDFSRLGKNETGGHAGLGMWMDFMEDALKDKPNATLPMPKGMVKVGVDKKRGTETKGKGEGVEELAVREELRLMLMGPEPVAVQRPRQSHRVRPPPSEPHPVSWTICSSLMRLERIKLAGFKSFVDPTTVPFPSNLVGIVGPNGCGKSNVIDAVRWVMGESSAKMLRGQSMADVIFNGSSGRKPVGMASIEMVFDNADGSAGGEYAQYAQISVKRQVSRDGQSNYFLNGARCRRRDIQDLFLGTGLGPRSYSIIEQGMVSRLIEAKPEDLRLFLEEAAGISKYKERRRETETRIASTRDNLDRLTDLRDEVAKQLAHLERQAATAERYQRLKAEERRLAAELKALRWRVLDAEIGQQDRELAEQDNQVEAEIARQRRLEADIEAQREAYTAASEAFNQVQGRFYAVGLRDRPAGAGHRLRPGDPLPPGDGAGPPEPGTRRRPGPPGARRPTPGGTGRGPGAGRARTGRGPGRPWRSAPLGWPPPRRPWAPGSASGTSSTTPPPPPPSVPRSSGPASITWRPAWSRTGAAVCAWRRSGIAWTAPSLRSVSPALEDQEEALAERLDAAEAGQADARSTLERRGGPRPGPGRGPGPRPHRTPAGPRSPRLAPGPARGGPGGHRRGPERLAARPRVWRMPPA